MTAQLPNLGVLQRLWQSQSDGDGTIVNQNEVNQQISDEPRNDVQVLQPSNLPQRENTTKAKAKSEKRDIHLLPDEILVIILRQEIVPCEVLYHTCTSASFPWVEHACINDVFEHLPHWTSLRLVCRCWARILHLSGNPFGQRVGNTGVLWTPRVEVDWGDTSFHVYNPMLLKLRNNRCSMSDKMLKLLFADTNMMNSTSTLQIYERRQTEEGSSAVKQVFDNIQFFPKVKSLTIVTSSIGILNYWKRLEQGFSRISALFITVHEPIPGIGRLELNELEVLQLKLRSPLECRFPSLKHCSVDSRTPTWTWMSDVNSETHLYDQLLQDHGKQLVSVILLGWPSSYFDGDDFWIRYPNVQLVGLSDDNALRLRKPPTSQRQGTFHDGHHPISHLYLDIRGHTSLGHSQKLVRLIRSFRKAANLQRLSVAYAAIGFKSFFDLTLYEECMKQGVEYRVIE